MRLDPNQLTRQQTQTGKARLTRTAKVIHEQPIRDGGRVIYRHTDDSTYDPHAATLYLSSEDHLDMGCPDTLTVTIEPGDRLNETAPRVGGNAANATKNRVSGYNPKGAQ